MWYVHSTLLEECIDNDQESKLRIIETYADLPLDQKTSFRIYLGRNIPKVHVDDTQVIITDKELDVFFDTQEILDSLPNPNSEIPHQTFLLTFLPQTKPYSE